MKFVHLLFFPFCLFLSVLLLVLLSAHVERFSVSPIQDLFWKSCRTKIVSYCTALHFITRRHKRKDRPESDAFPNPPWGFSKEPQGEFCIMEKVSFSLLLYLIKELKILSTSFFQKGKLCFYFPHVFFLSNCVS